MKTLLRALLIAFATASAAQAETHLYVAKQPTASSLPPIQVTVPVGERITLTFPILSGNVWLKDGLPVLGDHERDLVIEAAQPADSGVYRVLYLGQGETSSQEVAINVISSVSVQPAAAIPKPTPSFLIFTSRAIAGVGSQAMVAGFVVDEVPGNPGATKNILVRAIGPGLMESGFMDAMTNPVLSVYNQFGQPFASQTLTYSQLVQIEENCGAAPLKPGTRDVWMYLTLRPGAYAAYAASGTGISGRVLLEVYSCP